MRKTLQDKHRAQKRSGSTGNGRRPVRYLCPNCGRPCRDFEIVEVVDVPEIPTDFACTTVCLADHLRDETHKNDKAEWATRKKNAPWETDFGLEIKAQRNRLLDQNRWAVMPDSPLTSVNQDEWLGYLRALHSLTKDFQKPENVVWPIPPALIYVEKKNEPARTKPR